MGRTLLSAAFGVSVWFGLVLLARLWVGFDCTESKSTSTSADKSVRPTQAIKLGRNHFGSGFRRDAFFFFLTAQFVELNAVNLASQA